MIKWESFKYNGTEYDLSHIHPETIKYIQPAKGELPEKIFTVEICYSLHCFTKGNLQIPEHDPLRYSDARETRLFDFYRYELSKKLPDIIKGLDKKPCMHTGHGNFFVIEIIAPDGKKEEYEVYFEVKKSKPNIAHLMVNSAFVADGNRIRKQTKKISLYVILTNKLTGKPIKIQN